MYIYEYTHTYTHMYIWVYMSMFKVFHSFKSFSQLFPNFILTMLLQGKLSEHHFKDEEIVDDKDLMNFIRLQRKNPHLLTYSFQNLNCIRLQKID